ncbi:MAG: hypothetical protein IRZ31_18780 [Thermogemmatispora sp.]|uniref:competence protein CoiA n=1 Tax=Thermogemmatispora sp. TaxID=1968838 RepID=UPI002619F926|nr:competence protein CoiA family protein [Thermogemmatispora sp.]MBX5458944.1 hypothetical protein [Thermogemmatispora sp.]
MLVAYGPDGQPVVADERSLSQLQEWSQQRQLFCPNCRAVLHLRGGPARRTQLHFAHRKGECPWSTEEESERHMRGKAGLAVWLHQQFPAARITLEERLPEPNRIADVFVKHPDGRQLAVEFQCAPLELDEWQRRHQAYQQAGITDLWIIGSNRRDKQEAFQEAILESSGLLVFLDPLLTPARAWLRWPLSAQALQAWQEERFSPAQTPNLSAGGWVGRLGYGMTLSTTLGELHLNEQGEINHPQRAEHERRLRLRHLMTFADSVDENLLAAYLYNTVSAEMIQRVLRPLLRAYRSDPDLLRRYNYGRGTPEQPVREEDRQRVARACAWLRQLARQGFPLARLRAVAQEIPFVGPYAAFVRYIEMLVTLAQTHR